jgi:hypothetical protein
MSSVTEQMDTHTHFMDSSPIPHSHIGRSFRGHPIENECPCPQEPCGLVDTRRIDPDCPQHALKACKTIRASHPADKCPGEAREAA